MKKAFFTAACLSMMALAVSCQDGNKIVVKTDKNPELQSTIDSLSWAMGFSIAQSIAGTGIEPNREILFEAICATLDSRQQALTEDQTYHLLNNIERIASTANSAKLENELKEVREREEAYFKELTKNNPNVIKCDKGFYYEVLKEGKGEKASIGQVVTFDYKGSLTNGQVFDQTYGNRDAITHIVGEPMFPGLVEGMCLMNEGSTYRFYFPSEMAFGRNGGDMIPANSIVIYEVELHNIRKHQN